MRPLVAALALALVACTLDNPAFGERGESATATTADATGDPSAAASTTADSATTDATATSTSSSATTEATETCGDTCTTTGEGACWEQGACEPEATWIHHYPRTHANERMPLALLSDGSVVAGGRFVQGEVELAGQVISTEEAEAIYVARIAPSGELMWIKPFAGEAFTLLTCLASDSADRIYLGGAFHDKLDLGGGPLMGGQNADIFFAVLDSDGDVVDARAFPALGNEYVHTITPTADGLVIAGRYDQELDFGAGPLPPPNIQKWNYFVAGFELVGKTKWARGGGPADATASIESVTAGPAGELYATGYFSGALDLEEPPLAPIGTLDAFVAKLDAATGDAVWVRAMGSAGVGQYLADAALDASGDVWVVGACDGEVDLGGAKTSCPSNGIFVAKLAPNGAGAWAWTAGGPSYESATSVAITPTGHGLVVASFTGTVTVGADEHTAAGYNDLLMVEFDGAGAPLWSRSLGGVNPDMMTSEGPDSVVIDGGGAVTFTAAFYEVIDLDEPPVPIPGAKHSAILRFTY